MRCLQLPESTPRSHNIPHFLTTICDPPRIYSPLPEYTPIFNNYMRPSQNLPLRPRRYPLFNNYMCDPLRIYPSLPEYTPSLFSYYMRPSQNLPLPPRIFPHFQHLYTTLPESTPPSQYIPPFLTTLCDPLRIYPSLPDYTTSLFSYYMRPSQNIPLSPRIYPHFQQLYATLRESTSPSQNIPPFSTTICDPPRIYP